MAAEWNGGVMSAIIPIPKMPITIRPATMEDLPFIDSLQKKHTKQVGFMPTKALEGKVRLGQVLVAEERSEVRDQKSENACLTSDLRPLTSAPVGYLIGNDQYFKRDDVGIIYQINIAEGKRRSLVGATLLKAQFERSAYGCRLYCCWCAQDIEANRFWESMGFVPLAFRTGSAAKSRVHIFWQRRIRAGDETTPYWFPAQTNSGSIREDRLVLPIPPGTSWRDVMPIVLPGENRTEDSGLRTELEGKKRSSKRLLATGNSQLATAPVLQEPTRSRVQFGKPSAKPELDPSSSAVEKKAKVREKKQKVKNDPKLVAAARELRDRWMEKVNSEGLMLESRGKYEICRGIEGKQPAAMVAVSSTIPPLSLPAAA
jgi:hypothetical protein